MKKFSLIIISIAFAFIFSIDGALAKETITKTCEYDLDGMDQFKRFSAKLEVYTTNKKDSYKSARVIKDGSTISIQNWELNDTSVTDYEAKSGMKSSNKCPKYLVYYSHKQFANDKLSEVIYAVDEEHKAINISSKLENKSRKNDDAEYSSLITYQDFEEIEELNTVNLTCTYAPPDESSTAGNLVLKLNNGKWTSSNGLTVGFDPKKECPKEIYIDIDSKKIVDSNPNTPGLNISASKLISNESISDDKYKEVCGILTKDAQDFIYRILDWIKYGALVLTIGLSIFDFFKAVASEEDDAFKKAAKKLMRRVIVVVILFLLPVILEFILKLTHIQGVTDDPLCTK